MNSQERIKNWKLHDSQRGWFGLELYKQMAKNSNIWLIVGDLGYGIFDNHFLDFPERCINTGAAETAMMGIAVGLALEGKIPVVYSISTFLLRRPFETISLYVNHEQIPVKLIGSGRGRDYAHDGFSHWADDDKRIMSIFTKIQAWWPDTKEEIPSLLNKILYNGFPVYLNLTKRI